VYYLYFLVRVIKIIRKIFYYFNKFLTKNDLNNTNRQTENLMYPTSDVKDEDGFAF